jgi:hypothetical protein
MSAAVASEHETSPFLLLTSAFESGRTFRISWRVHIVDLDDAGRGRNAPCSCCHMCRAYSLKSAAIDSQLQAAVQWQPRNRGGQILKVCMRTDMQRHRMLGCRACRQQALSLGREAGGGGECLVRVHAGITGSRGRSLLGGCVTGCKDRAAGGVSVDFQVQGRKGHSTVVWQTHSLPTSGSHLAVCLGHMLLYQVVDCASDNVHSSCNARAMYPPMNPRSGCRR